MVLHIQTLNIELVSKVDLPMVLISGVKKYASDSDGEDAGCSGGDDGESNFLRLPPTKAKKARYPPGSLVLVSCSFGESTSSGEGNDIDHPRQQLQEQQQCVVLYGTVLEVGINLVEGGNRETLYKVNLKSPGSAVATIKMDVEEKELRYGPGATVWFSRLDAAERLPAMVRGCDECPPALQKLMATANPNQATDDAARLHYSVQITEGEYRIHHGVLPNRISYRASTSVTAIAVNHAEVHKEEIQQHQQSTSVPKSKQDFVPPSPSKPPASVQIKAQTTPVKAEVAANAGDGDGDLEDGECIAIDNIDGCDAGVDKSATIFPVHVSVKYKSHGDEDMSISVTSSPSKQAPSTDAVTTITPEVASSNTSGKHSKSLAPVDSAYIFNTNPNPFLRIDFGRGHDFIKALKRLQNIRARDGLDTSLHHGVGSMMNATCLWWHLRGRCRHGCGRLDNHVQLTPQEADALENALWPVISADGPIFCRPTNHNNERHRRNLKQARLGNDNFARRPQDSYRDAGFIVEERARSEGGHYGNNSSINKRPCNHHGERGQRQHVDNEMYRESHRNRGRQEDNDGNLTHGNPAHGITFEPPSRAERNDGSPSTHASKCHASIANGKMTIEILSDSDDDEDAVNLPS